MDAPTPRRRPLNTRRVARIAQECSPEAQVRDEAALEAVLAQAYAHGRNELGQRVQRVSDIWRQAGIIARGITLGRLFTRDSGLVGVVVGRTSLKLHRIRFAEPSLLDDSAFGLAIAERELTAQQIGEWYRQQRSLNDESP